jgi:GT2 family glycosyltransferase
VSSAARRSRRLAVAIATCDRPAELARCLDALLTADVLPSEITIVDQGRDERTRTTVEAMRTGSVRVTYVSQRPVGLSASRNAAIVHTAAPYIAFTDDDCVPHASWVDCLDRAFEIANPPGAMAGRVLALGPDGQRRHAVSLRTSTRRTDYRGRTVPWRVGTGANLAISREWIGRIGGFDERLGAGSRGRAGEDADVIYRLLVAGAHVRYEPDAIVYHERLTDDRRLATRVGYGHGIGAVCGIYLREGDLFALPMLANWAKILTRRLCSAAAAGDRFELLQSWLSLRGTVAGLAYGLTRKPSTVLHRRVGAESR